MKTALRWTAVASGVSATMSPILLFVPVYDDVVMGEHVARTAFGAGQVTEALWVIIPVTFAGLIALIGTKMVLCGRGSGRILIGLGATVLLGLSIFSSTSLGLFLFVPAFLMLFPAMWLSQE